MLRNIPPNHVCLYINPTKYRTINLGPVIPKYIVHGYKDTCAIAFMYML